MDVESLISSLVVQNIKSGLKKEKLGVWHEFVGLHSEGLSKAINLSKVCSENPKCRTQYDVSGCISYMILQVLLQTTRNHCFSWIPVESSRLWGYRVHRRHCHWAQSRRYLAPLQDTVPVSITNTIQKQFEPIMTSADTMQDVLILLLSHTCA